MRSEPSWETFAIGHERYDCIVDPDTAFWALEPRETMHDELRSVRMERAYRRKADEFAKEMDSLRFTRRPSAVYFNPTERCNLNCTYCYIPEAMRRDGSHMSEQRLLDALSRLKRYFSRTLPRGERGQIIFHGAEPLLNRDAVSTGISAFRNDFHFGIQTNATLLDDRTVEFLVTHGVSIGLSLDSASESIGSRTRRTWSGRPVHEQVVSAMDKLRGYAHWSVIATMARGNMKRLIDLVEFFHAKEVPTCMLNVVRCTLDRSRRVKPSDATASRHYLAALDRTFELYRETGRKLPVANFANILLAIIAPSARRLMCDISPCGGGRCFFALAPDGDLFPCSEFIGLDEFRGGNLFEDEMKDVLVSPAFRRVTERRIENFEPCRSCAIRHFCGAPCPAEVRSDGAALNGRGAFCEFYKEQARYAFRAIADNRHEAYLWEDWAEGTRITFAL